MSEEGKRAAVKLIRSGHRKIEAMFRSFSDEQLDRPVFSGEGAGWRVRDLIAHYAYWQALAARCAEKMATGLLPGPEDRIRRYLGIPEELDEMNDANFKAWRERGTDEPLAGLAATNARLIAAIERLPDEVVLTGDGPEDFHRFLWQPGVNHLRQHREHIDVALQKAATYAGGTGSARRDAGRDRTGGAGAHRRGPAEGDRHAARLIRIARYLRSTYDLQ